MIQNKFNKAYPAIMRLSEFRLPIKKARSVYTMSNVMREHFEFALSEEKKCITDCNGTLNQDGTVTFSNQEDLDKFQALINELNESDIEWTLSPIILLDDDIGDQTISVSDMRDLEGFVIFE